MRKLIALLGILALLVGIMPGAASAAPIDNGEPIPFGADNDNPSHPLGDKQSELKAKAFEAKLNGKAKGKVHEVARGQFVELEREGEDSIWSVLGEFGELESPFGILQGGTPGPLHNQIPEPDRSVDNTTIWTPDFNQPYYLDLLFNSASGANSMRNFYIEQSSGRYAVNGDVTNWVQVPYRAAHYGRNYCGGIVCAQTWVFVRDSVNAWYAAQLAAGKTAAEIDEYLSKYDVWDRYDYDGDGNFDEPDGYIDHFQSIHAGEGEEAGGGAQGSDAIWSHRWYAYYTNIGTSGPDFNKFGGVQIGQSQYWIGDYTIEPENGGVGIFAHEFGHDLGLPDLYDTSGNTGGAENSTGFWTLMSSGSWLGDGTIDIGSKPGHMSAYEKLYLGWLNYTVVPFGEFASVRLGPAETNTKQAQMLVTLLPDKHVDFEVGMPYSGAWFYHSGSGNNLDNSMTREVSLPAGVVSLSAKVLYDIELDWDYAYLTVNGDPVDTSLSTDTNPNGQNFGFGITGSSGGAWVDLNADLSAFAGQTVTIGFRYWTDVAVADAGLSVDDIAISGLPLDDAETELDWSFNGFFRTDGTISRSFFNAYFAEFRQYRGYDSTLQTGPYNFGFQNDPALGNWVEHFPYQDGLLVWYYDTSFEDNSIGDHCAAGRCGGLYLPVDAHPELLIRADGKVWRPRIQGYDSTFGLEPTDPITLHFNSVPTAHGGLPANPLFNDMQEYWVAPDPSINHFGWAGVQVPKTGTSIRVVSTSAQGAFMQVHVNGR